MSDHQNFTVHPEWSSIPVTMGNSPLLTDYYRSYADESRDLTDQLSRGGPYIEPVQRKAHEGDQRGQ